MKGYKEVFKVFLATQLEKEEAWLNEMSQQGYELTGKRGLCMYTFKEVEPTEYVYLISYYRGKTSENEVFLKQYTEAGFEYITYKLGYYYFKCKAERVRGFDKNIMIDLKNKRNIEVSNFLMMIFACNMPASFSMLHNTMESQGSTIAIVGISFLIAVNFILMGLAVKLRSQPTKHQ